MLPHQRLDGFDVAVGEVLELPLACRRVSAAVAKGSLGGCAYQTFQWNSELAVEAANHFKGEPAFLGQDF